MCMRVPNHNCAVLSAHACSASLPLCYFSPGESSRGSGYSAGQRRTSKEICGTKGQYKIFYNLVKY